MEVAGPLGTPLGVVQWKRASSRVLERNPQLSLATRGEDWASQGQPQGKAEIPVASLKGELGIALESLQGKIDLI